MGFLKFRNKSLTNKAYGILKKKYPHIEKTDHNIISFKVGESTKAYKILKKRM